MKNIKLKLGTILFILGLLGVFSLLTADFPTTNLPPEVLEQFSGNTIKWLLLINPTILLIIAVIVGTLLYNRVGLGVPFLESILTRNDNNEIIKAQLKFGIIAGVAVGVVLIIVEQLFKSLVFEELFNLSTNLKINPLVRFLYGGITEEILLRYGLMTFLAFILYKIIGKLNNLVYWIAIALSSILFAAGHLPAVFLAIESPSYFVILYILIANSIAGFAYGWLYWKKGLEASIYAHICTHIVFLIAIAIS